MKSLALALSAVLAVVSIYFAAPATAAPASCTGDYSIGVGGLKASLFSGTWEDSSYVYADQRIGYDSMNPMQGLNNLAAAYTAHRAECPADHVTLIGHSEGAGIVHAWVSTHQDATNTNAVLIADPKRAAGPGTAGLASIPGSWIIGYPLAGVDADFGTVPVLSVCHWDDVICNVGTGWYGYVVAGSHLDYDFYASDYPDDASGVWFF